MIEIICKQCKAKQYITESFAKLGRLYCRVCSNELNYEKDKDGRTRDT